MTIHKSLRTKVPILAGAIAALMMTNPVMAQSAPSAKQLMDMIQAQQQQLDALKSALNRAQTAAENAHHEAKTTAKAQEMAAKKSSFMDKITLGGVLEVEATDSKTTGGVSSSDIALATVEFFIDTQPHDYLSTHLQVIYEDSGDAINFDEASVTVGNAEKFPVYLQFGKGAVAFGGQGGGFDTDMSSDPLTQTFGELKEAVVEIGAVYNGFGLRGYLYNGDTQQSGGSDRIDQFGMAASYGGEVNDAAYNLGVSYISNLADSDTFTTTLGTNASSLSDHVAGVDVHADLSYKDFVIRGAYMQALDSFQSTEIAFNGSGAEPSAWHLEAAYTLQIMGKDTTFAATVQGTDEALALGLPETRVGGAVTVGIVEHFAVTAEYLHDEDYATSDGGTGNSGHTATLKLAAEF